MEVANCGTLFLDENRGTGPKDAGHAAPRFWNREKFGGWAKTKCSTWTSGSSAPQTGICRKWWRKGSSAKICSSGWTRLRFTSPAPGTQGRFPTLAAPDRTAFEARPGPADMLIPAATEILLIHDWSGNVRRNGQRLEHAVILSDGKTDPAEHLPASVSGIGMRTPAVTVRIRLEVTKTLREIEMDVIHQVSGQARGRQAESGPRTGNRPQNALQQAQPVPGQRRGRLSEIMPVLERCTRIFPSGGRQPPEKLSPPKPSGPRRIAQVPTLRWRTHWDARKEPGGATAGFGQGATSKPKRSRFSGG